MEFTFLFYSISKNNNFLSSIAETLESDWPNVGEKQKVAIQAASWNDLIKQFGKQAKLVHFEKLATRTEASEVLPLRSNPVTTSSC